MREIKFRQFIDGKMCPFGFVPEKRGGWSFLCAQSMVIDRFPVMQFTGLKDINGTEIYEGDILEFKWLYQSGEPYISDEPSRGFVKFIGGKFVVDAGGTTFDAGDINQATFERFWVVNYYMGVRADYFKMTCFSVIGNIHENPELLNE